MFVAVIDRSSTFQSNILTSFNSKDDGDIIICGNIIYIVITSTIVLVTSNTSSSLMVFVLCLETRMRRSGR